MTTPPPAPAVPDAGPAWVQRAERWLRYDSGVRQVLIVLAVTAATLTVVQPPAATGPRVAAYVLLVLNVVVMGTRVLPDRFRDRLPEFAFYLVGAALAGAVLAFDRTEITAMFGYFLAGNAGFRLATGRAAVVAATVATLATTGVLVGNALGWTAAPWYLGTFTGSVVLIGIANRSRSQAEIAMRLASESRVAAAEAESRATASAERARVARDVHDVLAHSLAGINMQLEVVDVLLENGDGDGAREAAAKAQRQVREGMAEVSRTVHALRADALPLVDTLASLVDTAAPVGTVLDVVGPRREVATPVATALARVAQESLTNAHKHAPGAPVRVTLTFTPGTTALDVVNGAPARVTGFTGTGSGMGLVGMRERVEIVGGRIRAGPVTDGELAGGWRVHVEVPA